MASLVKTSLGGNVKLMGAFSSEGYVFPLSPNLLTPMHTPLRKCLMILLQCPNDAAPPLRRTGKLLNE